jgi:hypothetical protein
LSFIRKWVNQLVLEAIETNEEAIEALRDQMDGLEQKSREFVRGEIWRVEGSPTASLGRILADHDQRNQRDAQSLANAMAEEFEYKTKGPYLTAGGIVVPAKFDKDGLKKAFRKARPK